MKQLITLTAFVMANLLAMNIHAEGTSAGTIISNSATVNYNVGASAMSATSTPVTITVQELINATLESKDAGKEQNVAPSQNNAALKFELTNTGNGNEAFILTQENLTGDQFNTTLDNVYIDDGDGIFEPATDVIYTPTSLAPDASITLWIASKDFTNTQSSGDRADIRANALSQTFSVAGKINPAIGDSVSGGGDSGTTAIHATSGPSTDTATFIVDTSAIVMDIQKSITNVRDSITTSGDQAIPGAEVDYLIAVQVTGSGNATTVIVTDPLPSELKLKNESTGIINVDGTPLTANIPDADGAYYDANTRTITVELGDITAGTATKNITFTTVIQ